MYRVAFALWKPINCKVLIKEYQLTVINNLRDLKVGCTAGVSQVVLLFFPSSVLLSLFLFFLSFFFFYDSLARVFVFKSFRAVFRGPPHAQDDLCLVRQHVRLSVEP